jgi:hypothetical protein
MKRPPAKKTAPPEDNVIALSRYRAQLGRGKRARRAEELFASPEPERAIRALPPDEFYYALTEIGFPEAAEVLQYATGEQVRGVLDFVLWERDQLSGERLEEWLSALVDAPAATVTTWLRSLDVELVALMMRRRARIYDLSLDEPPEEPEGTFLNTPDRLFTLDLLGDEEQARVTARLIDALYREDKNLARRLLVGMRAELDAELEELAYRWRSGRMADLGFIDFYEALEIYREIDPASVRVGDEPQERVRPSSDPAREGDLRLPAFLAERLGGGSPFARAMGGVRSSDELADLHFGLVSLSNRALSADRVTPGDHERMAAVLARVAATLDLAIEFLARGSEERATAAVRSVPMVTLFQLGVSLAAKVQRLGLALRRKTPFARLAPEVSLFEPEDAELLAAVTALRPMFPRRLDEPPAAGERPFSRLSDLAAATAALERVGAAVAMLYGLGLRPEQLAPSALEELGVAHAAALDAGVVARTLLVPRLLGAPAGPLRALGREQLAAFQTRLARKEDLRPPVRAILTLAGGGALTPAMLAVADRWAASLDPLEVVITADGLRHPERSS